MRLALFLIATLAGCLGDNLPPDPGTSQHQVGNCFIGGCSREACTADQAAASPCIYKPEFACYREATCEPQPDGACGWTPTSELTACLAPFAPR